MNLALLAYLYLEESSIVLQGLINENNPPVQLNRRVLAYLQLFFQFFFRFGFSQEGS